jgi:hypothetical protein
MLQLVCDENFSPEWVQAVKGLAQHHYCPPYFVHLAANFLQTDPSTEALLKEVADPKGDFQPLREMEQYINYHEPVEPELKEAYKEVLAA